MGSTPSSNLASGESILLVDDDASIRTLVADVLKCAGYRVIAARSGADAIDAMHANNIPVDLVITDIVMPKVSGTELFAMVSRMQPRLPVLLMSGYSDGALTASGLVDGRTEFLAKPFRAEVLLARVRALLDAAA